MKSSYLFRLMTLLVAIAVNANCRADVILSIDNLSARPGDTVLLGVYASSETFEVISGFNLPMDYNADGFGDLPAGFRLSVAPVRNAAYANLGLDQPLPQIRLISVDAIVTGTGPNIALGNRLSPTKLFDLAIEIAPTAAVGTVVPFHIRIPNQPFASLFNVAGPSFPTVSSPTLGSPAIGSITIVGVPEPSGIALFLGAAAATLGARRRLLGRTGVTRKQTESA